MSICNDCPRRCGADRDGTHGYCGTGSEYIVSRAALHMWEEPPISGKNGSGTIFFGGCNLHCVFCQNRAISHGKKGDVYSDDALSRAIFELADKGAHNINFVTPTHYARRLASLLERIKPRLDIPIVYNCGGYESVEVLRRLDGLVDIYLPDFKYFSPELSKKYSHAADYADVAAAAITEMYRQRGGARYSDNGMLQSGLVVRHLVLPGCRADSMQVLQRLASLVPSSDVLLSLMSQYTPDFVDKEKFPELARRVTSFEYKSVLDKAIELGFDGFFQGRSSASAKFTPNF